MLTPPLIGSDCTRSHTLLVSLALPLFLPRLHHRETAACISSSSCSFTWGLRIHSHHALHHCRPSKPPSTQDLVRCLFWRCILDVIFATNWSFSSLWWLWFFFQFCFRNLGIRSNRLFQCCKSLKLQTQFPIFRPTAVQCIHNLLKCICRTLNPQWEDIQKRGLRRVIRSQGWGWVGILIKGTAEGFLTVLLPVRWGWGEGVAVCRSGEGPSQALTPLLKTISRNTRQIIYGP